MLVRQPVKQSLVMSTHDTPVSIVLQFIFFLLAYLSFGEPFFWRTIILTYRSFGVPFFWRTSFGVPFFWPTFLLAYLSLCMRSGSWWDCQCSCSSDDTVVYPQSRVNLPAISRQLKEKRFAEAVLVKPATRTDWPPPQTNGR